MGAVSSAGPVHTVHSHILPVTTMSTTLESLTGPVTVIIMNLLVTQDTACHTVASPTHIYG